jgi:nitroreductase
MNKISPVQLNELIKKRRSIFPHTYIDKPIPREIIDQVLENANWAPTHKMTEPWRFKVIQSEELEELGILPSETYKL